MKNYVIISVDAEKVLDKINTYSWFEETTNKPY